MNGHQLSLLRQFIESSIYALTDEDGRMSGHWTPDRIEAETFWDRLVNAVNRRYTPDGISTLKPNEVFVYGANQAYRHGAGAAKTALRFGARHGIGPVSGHTYGICTKDAKLNILSLDEIRKEIAFFMTYAAKHDDQIFLVTKVGCGLAGYTPEQIGPMFPLYALPDNVIIPRAFWGPREGIRGL